LKFPLELGRVITCILIGCLVSLVAKRYELPAAVSLAVAQLVMFGAGTITLIAYGRNWLNWFFAMTPWNVMCAMATVAGAIIIRMCRRSKQTVQVMES
jgi:ABC-type sulfate transport system permease component